LGGAARGGAGPVVWRRLFMADAAEPGFCMINTDTRRGASFPLRNRLARALWALVYGLLFRPSLRPMHRWRTFLLRLFGAKVGARVHVYPTVRIWAPWNLVLGNECGVADGAILYSQGRIEIGARAVVSQGAHLCTGTHDYRLAGFPLITKPIKIGVEAWIAAEAFVHPGVTIGEGAVIGARSVVTKDMPAWTVCSGHPCQPLKPRERPI
jgi:putative colanic acid biosynthesis acetyltransferase WcaF